MRRLHLLVPVLFSFACGPTDTARLYQTSPYAPTLDPAAIERLEHLGPTLIDKGVNFGVYSERAERIELLLFDNPEATLPTRQIPLTRFGNVWNVHVEGVGVGQHYGYVAWGPNWPYDPAWTPGTVIGFKADVDADGNRFNPNKLLWDPYSKAIHRDHDWSKGSLATGPGRGESTWAAASKSIVVQSKYAWSENETTYRARRMDENAPGHKWNDAIVYELHPKGFTANRSSGVEHPGTFRGLGEKVGYLKKLGVTVVHVMPPFEKPSEGGYWGYNTLSFFIPENTYSFRKDQQEIIDEFKWMVDQFHQADIEVMLDVVYNHTGEGGFWRDRLDFTFNQGGTGIVNIDRKEVVGLYNFRGLDNHAYYALTDDKQFFVNNTGVGNEMRCNHRPFRKLIVDSLRYWVEEMHVDGFRFDLAPVLGEQDLKYYVWQDPKNTVLQDIADDPVLQKYNTRLTAEPWAAGGYDLAQSFNGPNNNEFSNGFGTRIGLFPAATNKPNMGWGEWNGRFRDWWRAFWNHDDFKWNSREVQDGGFFLAGSTNWFQWNGRKPWHSYNFVTVHDGFTMYDLVSYEAKQNKCGPLNPVCCAEPFSPWCETESGESNNRSRNWNDEAMKRQIMRNLFVAMMISRGTPLLFAGDEWMRTQYGNNNAYSTGADNPYNWMDWGTWEPQDPRQRMFDFVRQMIAFRKAHQYAFAPLDWGQGAPFGWKSAQNTDKTDWGDKQLMMHFYDPSKGPELAVLINGEANDVTFTLPQGRAWKRVVDTQSYWDLPETLVQLGRPQRQSNNVWLTGAEAVGTPTYTVKARSVVILEAGP